ncbi:DHH phosphoesterases protein [Dioscorea alata]|uniref:DHH phosphoesterases protein n=2 Tax=Dioscorea alata TaxID=55571 RepID=A0ACB7UUX0_DIOAL|nr:DHH phosphoesterases protein [Dioscorea alata]KAH7664567.1 DHH phosphoesterases protein [Dioscorea alata]
MFADTPLDLYEISHWKSKRGFLLISMIATSRFLLGNPTAFFASLRRPLAMNTVKKSAVLYHYPCPDGAFAALAAHLYFSSTSLPVLYFPNTVYDPIRVDSLPLDDIGDVYLLDFVGPPGFVAELSSKVDSVTVLDHHKTALEALHGNASLNKNVTKIIDMDRSGATIAFDFFREKICENAHGLKTGDLDASCEFDLVPNGKFEKVNRLFKFIEDGDLWRWKLPHSKAFSSGLKDLNIEYNVNWNPALFNQLLELDPELTISRGQESLSKKQRLIDEVLAQSYEIALACGEFGHCLAVDADSISNLRSELGNQLADKSLNLSLRAIGAVVYRVPELKNNQLLKISLRSLGSEDTTIISEKYGGGGHQNASSFMLSCEEYERWKMKMRKKHSS